MNKAEALWQNFQQLETQWRQVRPDADKARGESIRKLWQGETIRFEYHEFSNREPVERIIYEARAVGQQELPLWGMGLISVWKPKKL